MPPRIWLSFSSRRRFVSGDSFLLFPFAGGSASEGMFQVLPAIFLAESVVNIVEFADNGKNLQKKDINFRWQDEFDKGDSISGKHPLFLGDIVIAHLTGKINHEL